MMRSVIKGGVTGAVVAVLGFGGISLILPAPSEPGAEVKRAGSTPEKPETVAVPAGSEFTRAATDRSPAMPTPDGAPLSAPSVTPSAPITQPASDAPSLAATAPAERPDAPITAPEPQPGPQGETVALASPVAPEAPAPAMPEAGSAAPSLAPADAGGDTPAVVPEAAAPGVTQEGVTEEIASAGTAPKGEQVFEPEPLADAGIGETLPPARSDQSPAPVSGAGSGRVEAAQGAATPQPEAAPAKTAETKPAPQPTPDQTAPDQTADAAPMPALPKATPLLPDMETPEPGGAKTVTVTPAQPAPEVTPAPQPTRIKPRILTLNDAPDLPGKPVGGFKTAPGVVIDRLPQVGAAAPATDTPEAQDGQGDQAPAAASDQTPLQRFAAPFTDETGKPRVSVVLMDPGVDEGALDPETITASGLPLTIAIDPTRPNAAQDAQAFRAAGYEVAILAADLPANAAPEDVEVALQAWRQILPEAIAVVDRPDPVFQNNRKLARQMVSALDRDGMALVTQKKGFDSANQIATSAGVPHEQVWRVLDANRERASTISRMLSRAGFEADRDGQVVVMLSAWPETLQGIEDWYTGDQGKYTLAPVSALALTRVAPAPEAAPEPAPEEEPKTEAAGQ